MSPKYGFSYYKENAYVPKHITVDLGGQTTARAGAALSDRQVIDVVDEKGEKIRGFFTQNEYVDSLSTFVTRAKALEIPEGCEALKDAPKMMVQAIIEKKDSLFGLFKSIYDATGIKDFSGEYSDEQMKLFKEKIDDITGILIRDYNLPSDLLSNIKDNETMLGYIKELLGTAENAVLLTDTHIDHQRQVHYTNINRRNNALSDYAELLGAPDLVARSTSMTIQNGNEVMHGSFMVQAKGISYDELMSRGNWNNRLILSGEALKQVSNLQILDFLGGNIDRHQRNLFYQVKTLPDGDVELTGIQGIDNDASFGVLGRNVAEKGYIFDKMSLIKDIKVIDKQMSENIMSLTPEIIESKLRIAGLSAQEIKAANERLTLMQENIQNKKIQIVDGVEEWNFKAQSGRTRRELSKLDPDVSDKNVGPDQRMSYNIMYTLYHTMNRFERFNKNANVYRADHIQGEIPVGKAINIIDSHSLRDHYDGFNHINRELTRNLKGKIPEQSFQPLQDDLKSMIKLMKEYSGKPQLSDMERNMLSEKVKALGEEARKYSHKFQEPPTSDKELCAYHAARNIIAYADFAREAIQKDAIEAERNLASKMTDDFRRQHHIVPTGLTLQNLDARVDGIKGRSTQFFKDMMQSYGAVHEMSEGTSNVKKREEYLRLVSNANKYLNHKIPNGEQSYHRLNDKEKRRVQFAKDLIEYGNAHIQVLDEIKEERAQKQREKKDYLAISDFHGECAGLVAKYRNAPDAEAKEKAMTEILNNKDAFKKGFENILKVSEQYDNSHDMQAACGSMIVSGVSDFMKTYLDCHNAKNNEAKTDVYEVLGMDSKMGQKVKSVVQKGKTVQEAFEKEKIQKAERKLANETKLERTNPAINPRVVGPN